MKRFLWPLAIASLLLLTACNQTTETTQELESKPPEQETTTETPAVDDMEDLEPEVPEVEENESDEEADLPEVKVNPDLEMNLDIKAAETTLGWIEGSVSYPSEALPEDLEVCAGQIEGEMYCTSQWIEDEKYDYGFGYKLAVPAGLYQVMAQRSSGGLIGWYSEFVLCGETVACTDHTPVEVLVEAGEGVEGIDPADWY